MKKQSTKGPTHLPELTTKNATKNLSTSTWVELHLGAGGFESFEFTNFWICDILTLSLV